MEHPYEITSLGKLTRRPLPGALNAQNLKQALASLAKYAAILEANNPNKTPSAIANKLVTSAIQQAPNKSALAASMAAPLRRNLDYHGIARRVLAVDPLPQGAIPYYDTYPFNFKNNHYLITSRGKLTTKTLINRVTVPSFTVFQSPSIKIGDIKKRRFNIIDRAVKKASMQIMQQEDADIFAALDAASGMKSIMTVDAVPVKKVRKRKKRNKRRNKLA